MSTENRIKLPGDKLKDLIEDATKLSGSSNPIISQVASNLSADLKKYQKKRVEEALENLRIENW